MFKHSWLIKRITSQILEQDCLIPYNEPGKRPSSAAPVGKTERGEELGGEADTSAWINKTVGQY